MTRLSSDTANPTIRKAAPAAAPFFFEAAVAEVARVSSTAAVVSPASGFAGAPWCPELGPAGPAAGPMITTGSGISPPPSVWHYGPAGSRQSPGPPR